MNGGLPKNKYRQRKTTERSANASKGALMRARAPLCVGKKKRMASNGMLLHTASEKKSAPIGQPGKARETRYRLRKANREDIGLCCAKCGGRQEAHAITAIARQRQSKQKSGWFEPEKKQLGGG